MLLAMAERRLGVADRLARALPDRPSRITHTLPCTFSKVHDEWRAVGSAPRSVAQHAMARSAQTRSARNGQ
jgi:hypothetical protein